VKSVVKILSFLALVSASWFAASAGPFSFSNPAPITINDSTNPPTKATPYPSTIPVTGLSGVVAKITVQLNNFSHAFPDDVDIVLVGPEGQNAVVMSNVGGGHPGAANINLILDDSASSGVPLYGPLVSGTFKPTKRLSSFGFPFPSPAPASPGGASLAVFNGSNPNGTWSLFIVDDANPDTGTISGGWSLTITTVPILLSITQLDTNVVISWTNLLSAFTLQTTPNPSTTWTNALPLPTLVSGQYFVTNRIAGPMRLYRLAR